MWRIRCKNKYFVLPLVPPFLSIIIIIVSQAMFKLLFSGIFTKDFYEWAYRANVRLSLGNTIFVFICPAAAIMAIALLWLKKITLLECIIDFSANALTPLLICFVLVAVNGGV